MTDQGGRRRSTRFRPGQSGNSNGRPRKDKAEQSGTAFDVFSDRRVHVEMQGVDRELTIQQGLFYRTFQAALAGDRMAIRRVLKEIIERAARRSPDKLQLPTFKCEYPDPADIDDALVILGIATQPEGRTRDGGRAYLQLEPWAVTSALARLKRQRLEEKQIREVKTQTRDPGSVSWPDGDA